jgi:hypothetical protein
MPRVRNLRPSDAIDVDKVQAEEYKRAFARLDEAHKRALGPSERRRIERQMVSLKRELNHIIQLGKNVDRSFERWVRTLNVPTGTA